MSWRTWSSNFGLLGSDAAGKKEDMLSSYPVSLPPTKADIGETAFRRIVIRPMVTRYLVIVAVLLVAFRSGLAQTFVGSGPDPACGGTELRVDQRGDRITYIDYTVWQSFRTLVEQYRPLPDGDWHITLIFYSSRWQRNDPLTHDRITNKLSFKASDVSEAKRRAQELLFGGETDWREEPKRLIEYFRANRREFEERPNQSMERTTARRASASLRATTCSLRSKRAFGGGRSSLSRWTSKRQWT
jgi:hypothetical protein